MNGSMATRRRHTRPRQRACAALYIAGSMLAATAAQAGTYLDITAGYNTGEYGIDLPSHQYVVTAEAGYVTSVYSLSVAVPYMLLTNDYGGGVIDTQRGWGDVVLQGSVIVWQAGSGATSLNGGVGIKLANGSFTKGLGAGGVNYSVYMALDHTLGGFTLTVAAGYVDVGSPPGVPYLNTATYGVNLQHGLAGNDVYISLQGQTAPAPHVQPPLEYDLGLFHPLNGRDMLKAKLIIGLSNGSPAYGAAVGLVRWF